jgi:hypothetical protein
MLRHAARGHCRRDAIQTVANERTMSKRWKTRKRNAATLEKSREHIDRFYETVTTELKRLAALPAEERERLRQLACK